MTPPDRLSRRVETDRLFVGYHLLRWLARHGYDETALCGVLGCDAATLARVRLCYAPRAGCRDADVRRVEAGCGLRPGALGAVLRGG